MTDNITRKNISSVVELDTLRAELSQLLEKAEALDKLRKKNKESTSNQQELEGKGFLSK